jgi:Zn finger protein HypA/HybF involved in hydrogenase expression
MNYHQQMKHPLWQKKRLEVMERSRFECENCGDSEEQLHVHHRYYRRGAMIWDYEEHELQCLCNKCHKDAHALDEQIRAELTECGYQSSLSHILGVLKGYTYGPHTTLPDCEEIDGFLGVYVPKCLADSIFDTIVSWQGNADAAISSLGTTYCDLSDAVNDCIKQNMGAVLDDARVRYNKRLATLGATHGKN